MLENELDVNRWTSTVGRQPLDVNLGLLDLFAWLADLGYLGLVRSYDMTP